MHKLTLEQRNKLDEIDFDDSLGNLNDVKWEQQFVCLLEFKRKHGHSSVPTTGHNAKKLGGWVNWQRLSYRRGFLKPERLKMLNSIGFVWMPRDKVPMASYFRGTTTTDIGLQESFEEEDPVEAEIAAGNIGIDLVNKGEQEEAWYCPLCQCVGWSATALACNSFIVCQDCGSERFMRCYPCAVLKVD
jgi:hypothetical protein